MKLIGIYQEPLKKGKRIMPRDVRNYLASITQNDTELHDIIMGHERKQPTFIYSMPNQKSFCVYSFKRGKRIKDMMELMKKRVAENPFIKIGGLSAEVGRVYTRPFDFTQFEDGIFERKLRSPMVIAAGVNEYAECRKHMIDKDGPVDIDWLKKFTAQKIKETVALMARDWFDEEDEIKEIMEDTILIFKDLRYFPIKYNDTQNFPAVTGTIISNKKLPMFIGYKSGMGYGELSSLKEMDRKRGVLK